MHSNFKVASVDADVWSVIDDQMLVCGALEARGRGWDEVGSSGSQVIVILRRNDVVKQDIRSMW